MTASPRILTVTLIRHAPTIYPKGTLPPYDAEVDLGDAEQIRRQSSLIPPHAEWWISPLGRCQKTADAFIEHGAAKPDGRQIVPDLEEQRYGDWHGQPIADIWKDIEPLDKTNWHFLHPEITPPNGESFTSLIERLEPVFEAIQTNQNEQLVLITHGMVIRGLIGLMLGLDAGRALSMKIEPLSVSQLCYMAEGHQETALNGGRWMINFLNRL